MLRRIGLAVGTAVAVALGVALLLAPSEYRRRLSILSVVTKEADTWLQALDPSLHDDPAASFQVWMRNAGIEVPAVDDGHLLVWLRPKILARLYAFCYDVLPASYRDHHSAKFSEIKEIDLQAKRPLTWVESELKRILADQEAMATPLRKSNEAGFNYFNFLPKFKGRAIPGGETLKWSSQCWGSITAHVEKTAKSHTLVVSVADHKAILCDDTYIFATASGLHVAQFPTPIPGTKKYEFKITDSMKESDVWDVDTLGVRVFHLRENLLTTMDHLIETLFLFTPILEQSPSAWAAERNVNFLRDYRGTVMKKRKNVPGVMVNESEIGSGDFLGIIRLDGLDTMLSFGMGSTTGHTAVAMWEDGQLYVTESTTGGKFWPTNGIQRTPYRKWLEQARKAGHNVVHAPMAPKYKAMFDSKAANAFFHKWEGLEYGFHGLLVGWIDTPGQNYPCFPPYDQNSDDKMCLEWEFLEVVIPQVTKFLPSTIKPFLMPWNIHMKGTAEGSLLSATEIYETAFAKGVPLDNIMGLVEKDGTMYPSVWNNKTKGDGIAMTCDVLVCMVWKAAGVFKDIGDDFNCGEQTNSDVYNLDILAAPKTRPASCVAADPDNALCQLLGDYELHLPTLGTVKPYKHMQEHCPTEPPEYNRPATC